MKPDPDQSTRPDADRRFGLTGGDRRRLRARGQPFKPALTVGRDGPTDAITTELDRILEQTSLVKVRVDASDRHEADRWAAELAAAVDAEIIRRMGRVVLLYRPVPSSPSR